MSAFPASASSNPAESSRPKANPPGKALSAPAVPTVSVSNASSSRARRTGTTRQRLGCLTCRHRRKKCDELYPICGHCRRLNLVCKREEPRNLIPNSTSSSDDERGSRSLSPNLPGRRASISFTSVKTVDTKNLEGFINPDMGRDTRTMLSYYTQVLAGLLTTTNDNNSFLSVFLPMAMESTVLQKSLIAWSSAHLSTFSKSHLLTALENRSAALLLVAKALSAPIPSPAESEVILAACLVLSSTEVAFGDTCFWLQHLLGARQIILQCQRIGPGGEVLTGPSALMKSRDGQWLLRNFAYHDVLGAVTTLDSPLILGSYWIDETLDVIDSYVGIGSKVLALLSEVCALDTSVRSGNFSEPDWNYVGFNQNSNQSLNFWYQANDIEARLKQWTCPASSDMALVELAESYRSASLVVLYRKQRIHAQKCLAISNDSSTTISPENQVFLSEIENKIASAVNATMLHISLLPLQALTECGLLFPLFIAGGDATKPEHIEVVRARLSALREDRGFANIGKSTEVLEELWRGRASGFKGEFGPLDWLDVLKGREWKLTVC